MKYIQNKLLIGITAIALTAIFAGTNFAQSQDIDNPTPLKSRVLTGELVGNSKSEYFYSFYAEKGSFTVTMDVKTTGYNSTLDATFISNANSGSGFGASAVHRGSDRQSKTFNVAKRKKIIMKLTDFSTSDGTFKITVAGDVSLPK